MAYQPLGMDRNTMKDRVKPFIVTLARQRQPAEQSLKRGQVVERGMASSKAFCQHLIEFVDQTDRGYELVKIGDPTSFGIVSIVTTKELADEINRFPEVESVIEDTASMVLIR
jgi:hypothetical protein